MKRVILCFIVAMFCASVHGQKPGSAPIAGSWLNVNISNFYEAKSGYDCDNYSFDNDKFRPLYLSFINKNKVLMKFRVEGGKLTGDVHNSKPGFMSIHLGKNIYKISLLKDVLQLQHEGHLISFKKVSDNFSEDALGEYIKDMIFNEHKNYVIKFFKESNNYSRSSVNKGNFQQKIQQLFKCDAVEFVKLGRMRWGDTCLPEIALYFHEGIKSNWPRTLGILKDKGEIRFIDRSSGDNILILRPN